MKPYCAFLLLLLFTGILSQTASGQGTSEDAGSYFNYNGTNLYYEEYGAGEPLLLLHTFYGTIRQWKDHIPEYAKNFRVIAVDMFGHGKSDIYTQGKEFRHLEYAKAVLALLDHLNIKSTHAIGASSGAITLLHANYLQPHRFKSVVEIGGQSYFTDEFRMWLREERGADSANVRFMNIYYALHGPDKAKLLARQFWHMQYLTGDPAITPDMMKTFTGRWLVVQGDNDFIGLHQALDMYEHIPNAYLWIYPDGGHFPHLQKENIAGFNQKTTAFMQGHGGE